MQAINIIVQVADVGYAGEERTETVEFEEKGCISGYDMDNGLEDVAVTMTKDLLKKLAFREKQISREMPYNIKLVEKSND